MAVNYANMYEPTPAIAPVNQFEEEREIDVQNHLKQALIEEDIKDSVEFDKEHTTNVLHLMVVGTITLSCMLGWFILTCKNKAG